ncbi:3-deoxy-D-manno-octulosonic acid transferase [Phenylobacterium immobile]|uniref:3-deoxy-D-manno-octulosonic acid transferase n=1 Tax=Phenylobacterium immobile TaxID=21 RepID=UPI000A8D0EB4|nr:glycosyltransferase N-terminal domain-containing protein [Phenylobacterium immobile]
MRPPTPPLAIYRAATALAAPLAPAVLRRRAAAGKEDPVRWTERLGRPSRTRPPGPLVWLHGASVGESLSLLPVISGLLDGRPDLTILLTSGTVTSGRVLSARLRDGVIHQYAPVDTPGAARAFLDAWRPDVCILAESELWPNLIFAAKARGARLALISARMTLKTARGWAMARGSARALLNTFEVVLPQDAASAARLADLGAQVGPSLNLKLVGEPLTVDEAALAAARAAVGARPVILANSTHPGEEAMIARAVRAAAPFALLVIAPRHPERGRDIAEALDAPRRTLGAEPDATAPVYVADTLGELGLWIRLADVVVMGGGFARGVGGHNPMETARLGRPILTGPYVANAQSIFDALAERGAALIPEGEAELARDLAGLLGEPQIARRMAEAARTYAEQQGEALDVALAALARLLPA